MYCPILYCNYPNTHIKSAHKCGKCNSLGHGQVECKNQNMKRLLESKTSPMFLPKNISCEAENCPTYWQHTTDAHHCSICNNRHTEDKCDQGKDITVQCPVCKTDNDLNTKTNTIFGLSETCKICMDNTVNILLPVCKHACICDVCVVKL